MIKFRSLCLLLATLTILVGCQSSRYAFDQGFGIPPTSKEEPLVQFVMDADGDYAEFRQSLEYAKFPQARSSVKRFNTKPEVRKGVRVVCMGPTWDLTDQAVDSLKAFVARGGMLYLAERNWDERFSFLMGLRPEFDMQIDQDARGITFENPVLPGLSGLTLQGSQPHQGLKASNFSERSIVHATAASDPNYPLLIENPVGMGRVMLYNSGLRFGKVGRGLFFAGLLAGLEGIPYPQLNVAAIFLDDFPSPLYDIPQEPIYSELKLNISEFVEQVWWPDMEEIAREFDMKYTAYACFDYNDRVSPPFMFLEWDALSTEGPGGLRNLSSHMGRQVLNAGHELGLHGYNHQSLLKGTWPGKLEMRTALQAASKKWMLEGFESMPQSYVPPSNYIDSLGLQALAEAFPGIKYIQSTYLGDFSMGGDREFGPEPWNNRYFNFPRISSGFLFEASTHYDIASLYLTTGIWSHFVHPDDVYQVKSGVTDGDFKLRNHEGLGWRGTPGKEGMIERFRRTLKELKTRHPLMRFKTASEASLLAAKWRYAYFDHLAFEDFYTVGTDYYKNDPGHEQFWAVFLRPENNEAGESALKDQNAVFYTVPFLKGNLFNIKSPEHFITMPDVYPGNGSYAAYVLAEQRFQQDREELLPFSERVKLLVKRGNLDEATLLMEKFLENASLDMSYWKDYFTYRSWQEKDVQAWEFLDSQYDETSGPRIVRIANEVSAITGYPSEEIRHTWMKRQIEWGLTDETLLADYIGNYNIPEEKYFLKEVHETLLAVAPNPVRHKAYLQHLLQYELEGAYDLLRELQPCEALYRDMAYPIAWSLAGKEYYNKALEWATCTQAIDKETLDYWTLQSDRMQDLRSRDEFRYFEILMDNDPKQAAMELVAVEPCGNSLSAIADDVARNLSSYGYYAQASEWLPCTTAVNILDQMEWLYEAGRYQDLEQVHHQYRQENPGNQEAANKMTRYYLYMDRLPDAGALLAALGSGEERQHLLRLWNAAVKTSDLEKQKILYHKYPQLLQPSIYNQIEQGIRSQPGHALRFDSNSVNDRLDPTVLQFQAGYDLDGREGKVHEIRAIRSFAYPINFLPENAANEKRDLLGIGYTMDLKERHGRKFRLGARLENDGTGQTYFHINGSAAWSKDENFKSLELKYAPVQTGPGYIAGIYQVHAEGYSEWWLSKVFKVNAGIEGNYYTDEVTDITGNIGNYIKLFNPGGWHAGPFLEASYARSTANRRDGFPYWTANNRFYGGGGLSLTIGKMDDDVYMEFSAAHFYENQAEPAFERYLGTVNFRIRKFTTLSLGGEVYTIPRFFSNAFRLGLSYQL